MNTLSCVLIGFGLVFALAAWLLSSAHRELRRVLLALADHGPCTGLELKRAMGYKYNAVYASLEAARERGLVATSYRVNSATTAARRGELKTRVFRLTTEGWQAVTRLRAGKSLYEAD